MKQQK